MNNLPRVTKFNSGWCFAIVNGRLAEIFFDKKYGIYGHCYVKREEYSKKEHTMIDFDITKHQFIYRKKFYIDKKRGVAQRAPGMYKIFPEIKKYKNEAERIRSLSNVRPYVAFKFLKEK